jgi:hypothetical protein
MGENMKKILINTCHGGFGLSDEAMSILKLQDDWCIHRDDPKLIRVVEKIGPKRAASQFAELKIVEIPDDVDWEIEEYDGKEWVSEVHRTWS